MFRPDCCQKKMRKFVLNGSFSKTKLKIRYVYKICLASSVVHNIGKRLEGADERNREINCYISANIVMVAAGTQIIWGLSHI